MPTINVSRTPYDFASIQLDFGGLIVEGARSISYSDQMETEKLYGASREALGRTDGVYSAEDASVTFLKSDWDLIVTTIGNGYMRESKKFQASVTYGKDGQPTQTDELVDCRIVGVSDDHSQGPDGLEVEVTLSVMRIKRNGIDPVALS